jgi:hypothetical protein
MLASRYSRPSGFCGGQPASPSYRWLFRANPRYAAVVTYIHQNAFENKVLVVRLGRKQNLHAIAPGYDGLRRHLQKKPVFHHSHHIVQLLV